MFLAIRYHVLKALTWTHRGKVDAIYIDPPYNTGAKDWKYNNDYVEGDDLYRHSKWLTGRRPTGKLPPSAPSRRTWIWRDPYRASSR